MVANHAFFSFLLRLTCLLQAEPPFFVAVNYRFVGVTVSANYANRNRVPLEIVSKVILRHQDLKTTQAYLGKVSESETIRWMDILHEK